MSYMRARRTTWITHKNRRTKITEGDVAEAESEMVRDHPHLWAPLNVRFRAGKRDFGVQPVEQATAAPGEKRELQFETRAVREWAAANGYDVSPRGKLPADVVEAYQAAHPGE